MIAGIHRAESRDRKRARRALATAGAAKPSLWRKRTRHARRLEWQAARLAEITAAMAAA